MKSLILPVILAGATAITATEGCGSKPQARSAQLNASPDATTDARPDASPDATTDANPDASPDQTVFDMKIWSIRGFVHAGIIKPCNAILAEKNSKVTGIVEFETLKIVTATSEDGIRKCVYTYAPDTESTYSLGFSSHVQTLIEKRATIHVRPLRIVVLDNENTAPRHVMSSAPKEDTSNVYHHECRISERNATDLTSAAPVDVARCSAAIGDIRVMCMGVIEKLESAANQGASKKP